MSEDGSKWWHRRPATTTLDEYMTRGAYHVELRLPKSWLPRYFRRFHIVEDVFCRHLSREARIIDIGAGEGALVERLERAGFRNVVGLDAYGPTLNGKVIKASVSDLPFPDETFNAMSCLDVVEHVPLNLQLRVMREMERVLRPGGVLVLSAPNMAHLRSRLDFFLKGKPWRNRLDKHPGELSSVERIGVLTEAGFVVGDTVGLHLTLCYNPCPAGDFGKLLTRVMFSPFAPSGLCWTVVVLAFKRPAPKWAGHRGLMGLGPLGTALAAYRPDAADPTWSCWCRRRGGETDFVK